MVKWKMLPSACSDVQGVFLFVLFVLSHAIYAVSPKKSNAINIFADEYKKCLRYNMVTDLSDTS